MFFKLLKVSMQSHFKSSTSSSLVGVLKILMWDDTVCVFVCNHRSHEIWIHHLCVTLNTIKWFVRSICLKIFYNKEAKVYQMTGDTLSNLQKCRFHELQWRKQYFWYTMLYILYIFLFIIIRYIWLNFILRTET